MNGQIKSWSIDNLKSYENVIAEEEFEEAIQSKLINKRGRTAQNDCDKVGANYSSLIVEVDILKANLTKLSGSYSHMSQAYKGNAIAMNNLMESARNLSEQLKESAATIRKNLVKK